MSTIFENTKELCYDKLSPANDFYSYVNQEWLDNPMNSIPDDYSSWGGFTKLHDDGLKNQISMVKNMTSKNIYDLNPEQQKIVSIWNASSERFKKWSQNESDYTPIVNEINILNRYIDHTVLKNHTSVHLNNIADYLHYSQ